MVPWANRNPELKLLSIGSAVFAGLTSVTDRPTDGRPRYSVCNMVGRVYVRSRPSAMRPSNVCTAHRVSNDVAPNFKSIRIQYNSTEIYSILTALSLYTVY